MPPTRRPIVAQAAALWAAMAVVVVAIGWTDVRRVGTGETGDLVHFYAAAAAVRAGGDPYAAGTRGYIYPPLLAFVAQPLAALPMGRAAAVLLGVNVAVTLATLVLLAAEFLRRFDAPRRDAAAVAAAVLAGLLLDVDKVKGEWQMWQTDVWMLLLFAVGLRWVDRRPILCGLALGLGANLKYLPLLFVPYLIVRRRWAAAVATVASAAAFAVVPAAQVGWAATGRLWAMAGRGLTDMAGGSDGGPHAEVHGVADSLSCSITSAIARHTSPAVAFAVAAGVGVALLVGVGVVYRRRGVPLVCPTSAAVTGVEWAAVVAALLAFSPQTNTRHLYDALIVTTAAAVLLMVRWRWPLAIGCGVLVAGFTLPPGHRTVQGFWSPTVAWLRVGGPCWCLLVAAAAVWWAGLAAEPCAVKARRSSKADAKADG